MALRDPYYDPYPGQKEFQPGVSTDLGGGVFTPDAFNQLITDSSSFSATLDSGTRNAIQWITAKDRILIGTADAEWRMSGHSNKPLTPSNFDLKKQTVWGSKDMQPLVLHEAVLFVDSVGRKLREMVWDGIDERYLSPDLMLLAEHITLSGGITTMAYQKNPDSIIWATLANGDLISCTYDKSQKVVAWARHPLISGGEDEIAFDGIDEVLGVPDTYRFTYISENGAIWGIPVGDRRMTGLDIDDVAVDIGGGIVGLPFAGHPFTIGETVRISGTTNYNGSFTVEAGTTTSQIRITDTYVSETFDSTEVVVKYIGGLSTGAGRMVQDSDGNMYYGHTWSAGNSTLITKIETDGTLVYDYLDMSNAPPNGDTSSTLTGLAITPDGLYIYAFVTDPGTTDKGYIYKWNLSTGAEEWITTYDAAYLSWPFYDLDVDADGNAYFCSLAGNRAIGKISSDGATISKLTYMGEKKASNIDTTFPYVVLVDNDMGIVITGGQQYVVKAFGESEFLYNLAVRTLDNSTGDQIVVGGLYGYPTDGYDATYQVSTGHVVTYDGVIYALLSTPTPTLYKITWDGSSLAVVDSTAVGTYATGMYFDLYGNLVVVNQDWITGQDDVLWFYDTDLNYLSKIENMYPLILRTWDAAAGSTWIQGNAVFDGTITDGTPAISEVTFGNATGLGANSVTVIPGEKEDEVWISVSRSVGGVLVRYIERMKLRNWGTDQEDAFFVDSGLTYNGEAISNFTGLEHLEGEEVAILGDGMVFPTQTVTNGTLPKDLDQTVTKAHIGLPYTYKVKPMRMDQATARGTSKGSIKKIYSVVVSLYKTMNAKYGNGKITSEFKYPPFETYSTPAELYTGDVDATLDGGYDVEDPIEITGSDPLSCTVRAIIPRLDVTGK